MTQALMGVAESTAFNTPSGRNSLSGTQAEGLEWPAPWGVYCSVGGIALASWHWKKSPRAMCVLGCGK